MHRVLLESLRQRAFVVRQRFTSRRKTRESAIPNEVRDLHFPCPRQDVHSCRNRLRKVRCQPLRSFVNSHTASYASSCVAGCCRSRNNSSRTKEAPRTIAESARLNVYQWWLPT